MRRISAISITLALIISLFGGTVAFANDPDRPTRAAPEGFEDLRLHQPLTGVSAPRPSVLEASLLSATGTQQVVVRLSADAVGEVAAAGGSPSAQRRALGEVTTQQDAFLGRFREAVLGRVQVALNAVILEVDAERLAALAADPAVTSISPVIDYELALSDTVPYIGATDVQTTADGTGISVAVLDSGIDYTHAAFGGAGTQGAYDDAYGDNTESPENKDTPDWAAISAATNIVGGFDFVGEIWPDGRLAPDPDPIDCGGKFIGSSDVPCEGGHGTHVADIIGGVDGVAPGVELHAVKVCSAVSTSCSGVALLLGMDYALDPNADGDTSDRVDIINMSLGSPYGQAFDDDLSAAVEVATAAGVLTVASAGNSSDKPYVTGSPAAAPSALSVAQTAVPSATLPLLEIEAPSAAAGQYPAVFQPWSLPLEDHGLIDSADVQYGDGAGGNLQGCDPFAANSLIGLVVLVDRGVCDFSLKIANVAAGGAEAGIIGLIAPGEPFEGGFGACPDDACADIPGFMVHQSTSAALKSGLPGGTVVTLDPAGGLDLIGTMVGSSSRGPAMLTNAIKPEIGAPGASISAEAGTATGTTPFGGTSGAAPMVSGAAALLMDALAADGRSPAEIKSLLMNYAETEIYNGAPDEPISAPLAAVQRIGAGEVRVNNALDGAAFAAWDSDALTAALSFGFLDAYQAETVLTREVTVKNYDGAGATFAITPEFRFEDDELNAAVSVSAPASVAVPADGTATFEVTLTIDGAALRAWTANSGANGASAAPFDLLEYDGYLHLTADGEAPLHLAWHVLPRQAGATTASDDTVTLTGELDGLPAGSVSLNNAGAGLSAIDGYSLLGESPPLPSSGAGMQMPTIDLRYAGVQTIPVPAGFCSASPSFLMLFAVNTWERQTHANAPAAFEWQLDTNGDGSPDWAVYNFEQAGNLSDGRNWVIAAPIGAGDASVFFYTDHGTNSGNTVLTICGEQIGMDASDYGTPITADLLAVDVYFTGRVTDQILGMEFSPLGERYFPLIGEDGFGSGDVPAGGSETLTVMDFGAVGTNPSELGVLLFTDAARSGFRAGAPQTHETIVLSVEPGDGTPPPDDALPFDDIEDSDFVNDIVWAFENGITGGCSTDPPLYCPDSNVTREQMATFLDRMLDLPATSIDYFDDDDGSIHEGAINRLAGAGITGGCGSGEFCPKASVLRDQMASFLVRAFDIAPSAFDRFTDDERNIHEADINAVAAAGVTAGCGPTTYCPTNPVTRGQMAAFLHRVSED